MSEPNTNQNQTQSNSQTTPTSQTVDFSKFEKFFETLTNEITDLKKSMLTVLEQGVKVDRGDIAEIIKSRDEAKRKLRELQEENERLKQELSRTGERFKRRRLLEQSLLEAGIIDPDGAMKLLDLTDEKLDGFEVGEDGKLQGLDELLEQAKSKYPYLFAEAGVVVEEEAPHIPPAKGGGNKDEGKNGDLTTFNNPFVEVVNKMLNL